MECWRCGANLKDDASSCKRCGAALIRGEQPSPLSVALTLRPDLVAKEAWAQPIMADLDLADAAPAKFVPWTYVCAVLCLVSPLVFGVVGWQLGKVAERRGERGATAAKDAVRTGAIVGCIAGVAAWYWFRVR